MSRRIKTAVVSGGAGFLGSHLCDYLLALGQRVVCIDNLDTGNLRNIAHIDDERFTFVNHDVTEPLFLEERVDIVFHLASPASPIDYARLPLHTLKVGSYGTHHMLGLAKFKRARFLLASTSEVYGDPQEHPQPETYWGHVNPIGPRGVYDEAKRYAEALTMAYHRQQGVDTCIARIFNTYGPRMRPHDGRAIPTFLRQALAGEPVTIFGDGSQTRSFCYVDDLVRGLVLLAESSEHLPGQPRQPGGDDAPPARRGGAACIRLDERDRVSGASRRRPAGPPARHHAGPPGARVGADDRAGRRAPAHDRLGRGSRRRVRSRALGPGSREQVGGLALRLAGSAAGRGRGTSDALVGEAGRPGRVRIDEVPAVHDQRGPHRLLDLGGGKVAELGPFGDDDGGVGAFDGREQLSRPAPLR